MTPPIGPDNLRTRIAAVLSGHRPRWGEWVTCSCDDDFSRFAPEIYERHVADAVIEALGLTRVTRSQNPPIHRWVTEWEPSD